MSLPGTAVPAVPMQAAGGSESICDSEGKRLVEDCLVGGAAARKQFQEQFGPLIYRFAEHGARSWGNTEAGDFYVYLFEDDRLFRRLGSFEGRAPLGPFLRAFALPHLLLQFQGMKQRASIDTVSLDSDFVREPADPADGSDTGSEPPAARRGDHAEGNLLQCLSPEKRLLVKLLYIEDFELDPVDVQLLARTSGRSICDVIDLVERARALVRSREESQRAKLDEAESAAQWMFQYERRSAQIARDLGSLPPGSTHAERLRHQQTELERKRAWRQSQRERALTDSQRAVVTLRFKDIAELLNQPIGTVSSQITRLRKELLGLAAKSAGEQARREPRDA